MTDTSFFTPCENPLTPGIHRGISDTDYHADPLPTPGLSASLTVKLTNRRNNNHTPRWWWARHPRNPNRVTEPETSALNFGRAIHAFILERDRFYDRFTVSPYKDFKTKAARGWREEQLAAGRSVLDQADYDKIQAMAEAVQCHPSASKLIAQCEHEVVGVTQDKKTGVWLRMKADLYSSNPAIWIVDYKTARSAHPEDFKKAVLEYGYHQQAAFYLDVLEAIEGFRRSGFSFIVQEKDPPYQLAVYSMHSQAVQMGRYENMQIIDEFAQYLSEANFPTYDENPQDINLPDWHLDSMTKLYGHAA